MLELYQAYPAARKIGIGKRTLDRWREKGYIQASGSYGGHFLYSDEDIAQAVEHKELCRLPLKERRSDFFIRMDTLLESQREAAELLRKQPDRAGYLAKAILFYEANKDQLSQPAAPAKAAPVQPPQPAEEEETDLLNQLDVSRLGDIFDQW